MVLLTESLPLPQINFLISGGGGKSTLAYILIRTLTHNKYIYTTTSKTLGEVFCKPSTFESVVESFCHHDPLIPTILFALSFEGCVAAVNAVAGSVNTLRLREPLVSFRKEEVVSSNPTSEATFELFCSFFFFGI